MTDYTDLLLDAMPLGRAGDLWQRDTGVAAVAVAGAPSAGNIVKSAIVGGLGKRLREADSGVSEGFRSAGNRMFANMPVLSTGIASNEMNPDRRTVHNVLARSWNKGYHMSWDEGFPLWIYSQEASFVSTINELTIADPPILNYINETYAVMRAQRALRLLTAAL